MNGGDAARHEPGRRAAPPESEVARTTLDWPKHTGTTNAVLEELQVQLRLRRRRQRRLRGIAGAFVVLLAAGFLWQAKPPTSRGAHAPPSAMASVPTRQVLPDGSVVLLRAEAEIIVNFDAASRRVHLKQGEALFDVATNIHRPFIVRAGGVDVRAVGTAFAVNLQHSAVEVLVTEGKVAVEEVSDRKLLDGNSSGVATAPDKTQHEPVLEIAASEVDVRPSASSWMLDAGKRIVVEFAATALAPEVVPLSATEIDERLSWRVPRLQFARTPLREAVGMINQHSRVRLVLDGAALESVPLSGAIRADNIEALLELLELDYGIEAQRRGEAEIVLRKSL